MFIHVKSRHKMIIIMIIVIICHDCTMDTVWLGEPVRGEKGKRQGARVLESEFDQSTLSVCI
jgi:hypothetical protein